MTAQEQRHAWISRIEAASHDLGRSSTAVRVADLLREEITAGRLTPGERLPEDRLCAAARVSRNTMREAFRLLAQEGLVVHEFNRGVFVRRLTVEDLVDVYRMRRILECAGIQNAAAAGRLAIARVSEAVEDGERAAATGDWAGVGTADIAFHRALGALCASPRVDETMRRVLAELRLVFHVMGSPQEFHEPYLHRNRVIADLLWQGDLAAAERELRSYLDDAQTQLTRAYRTLS